MSTTSPILITFPPKIKTAVFQYSETIMFDFWFPFKLLPFIVAVIVGVRDVLTHDKSPSHEVKWHFFRFPSQLNNIVIVLPSTVLADGNNQEQKKPDRWGLYSRWSTVIVGISAIAVFTADQISTSQNAKQQEDIASNTRINARNTLRTLYPLDDLTLSYQLAVPLADLGTKQASGLMKNESSGAEYVKLFRETMTSFLEQSKHPRQSAANPRFIGLYVSNYSGDEPTSVEIFPDSPLSPTSNKYHFSTLFTNQKIAISISSADSMKKHSNDKEGSADLSFHIRSFDAAPSYRYSKITYRIEDDVLLLTMPPVEITNEELKRGNKNIAIPDLEKGTIFLYTIVSYSVTRGATMESILAGEQMLHEMAQNLTRMDGVLKHVKIDKFEMSMPRVRTIPIQCKQLQPTVQASQLSYQIEIPDHIIPE